MIQYRVAESADLDNIIDFINMVFSMLRVPHNFELMLPKVYGKEHAHADIHVIAEEDGKLCGCLGMHVFPLRISDESLKVGYLGSMAVHPRVRGRGVMGELMRRQIARGKELDLDMMVLGGQRQRYQYSGFELVGATYVYTISCANVRHALSEYDASCMRFRNMEVEDVPFALSLYNGQPVCGARCEQDFLPALLSYRRKAWTIEKNGEKIGYLCAAEDCLEINELLLKDHSAILPAVKAWVNERRLKTLRISAAPWDSTLNSLLAPICEGYAITPNCMLSVLKPERVLTAYMKLKDQCSELPYGQFVFQWGRKGTFELCMDECGMTVKPSEKKPEAVLSEIDALQLLFGYNRYAAPQVESRILPHWFPLPFHIPEPDSF